MSRKAARFTQADVARAIRAAKQAGAAGVRILPDGTIQIELAAIDTGAELGGIKTEPVPAKPRRFGDRIGVGHRQAASIDPLAIALERWERGEITLDQLPPGRYPNGMRVYADGEWEAIVRSRPLGKLERSCLKAYFEADGAPNFCDSGPATNEKLEARGFIEVSGTRREGYMPHYRITPAGKAEWLRLSQVRD
jgi:hypothetical protein